MIDNHMFVLNATGEERRHKVLFPLIKESIEKGESFFATNSNGQLINYLLADLKKQDYRYIYLDFSDVNADWQWNPLQYPFQLYKKGEIDSSFELVSLLASVIMGKDANGYKHYDPFWANTASGLFQALTMSLFENAYPQEVNLLSVLDMLIEGNTSFGGSTYLREYFSLEQCEDFNNDAAAFLNAPSETRGSISSVFIQGVSNVVGNKLFSRHLLTDSIKLQRIPRMKTAIIVNIPENTSNMALIGLLITQIYYILMKERKSIIHPQTPFSFYLDRFLSIGRLHGIEKIIASSLDYRIRFIFLVDSIAMLETVYGTEIGRAIREYCARWLIFPTKNMEFLADSKILLETYAGEKKEYFLAALRSNNPILFDEFQQLSIYEESGLGVFSLGSGDKHQSVILPQKPDIFSITNYVKEEKKKKLFIELEKSKQQSEEKEDSSLHYSDLIRKLDERIKEIEAEEAKKTGE